MIQLFDNKFESGYEDMLTVTSILENCPDETKRREFFKSVLPNTILEKKLAKLISGNKSMEAKANAQETTTLKTVSKSFKEDFKKACE